MFNPLKAAAEIENYKLSSPCIKSSMVYPNLSQLTNYEPHKNP